MRMRILRIKWQGPYAFADALTLNDEQEDYGVYQVYGEHVVFGDDALLYIGSARDQTFGRRLSQHDWIKEDNEIVVGRISESDYKHDPPDWGDWHELLEDVEFLEIYWHSPPRNSKNIKHYHGQPLVLINDGQRVKLSAGCESHETPYYIECIYIEPEMVSKDMVFNESRITFLEPVTVCIEGSRWLAVKVRIKSSSRFKEYSAFLLEEQ